MPVIFKLVGNYGNKKQYEIKDDFTGSLNLILIHEMFSLWGLDKSELDKIKFITDSTQINNYELEFLISECEIRPIFVFSSCEIVRKKLFDIFKEEGYEHEYKSNFSNETESSPTIVSYTYSTKSALPFGSSDCIGKYSDDVKDETDDQNINLPITENIKSNPIPMLTPEIIDKVNANTVELFSDPDFRNLIQIYIKKPELFSVFSKYIQNGNIITESMISTQTPDTLTKNQMDKYNAKCTYIKNLGIDLSDEIILEKLIKYSGHLNLTIRSLLCELSIQGSV